MFLKGQLVSAFAKATDSRLGQTFIRHAGKIACLSFIACDATLIGKDYIQSGRVPNGFEQASGLVFLLTDGILAMTDKYPKLKKAAGLMFIMGAGFLGYAGMGTDGQNMQLFSGGVIAAQGLAMIFESKLQDITRGGTGLLKKAFGQYSVASMAVVDILLSKVPLAIAAVQKKDPGLFIAAAFAAVGDVGLMGVDDNVKKLLKDKNSTPQGPLSPSLPAA